MKTDNEWDIGEEDCVLVLKSTGKAAMFPPTKLDELIPDTEEYAVIPQNIITAWISRKMPNPPGTYMLAPRCGPTKCCNPSR